MFPATPVTEAEGVTVNDALGAVAQAMVRPSHPRNRTERRSRTMILVMDDEGEAAVDQLIDWCFEHSDSLPSEVLDWVTILCNAWDDQRVGT